LPGSGSDRYAEENGSYGLMTLLREHVRCERGRLTFDYPAKNGRESVTVVTVAPARAVVCALRRRPFEAAVLRHLAG
jgi:DNA topoisomerase I